ncbi:MAG: bifunctional phosphopantothenoylcysteine decarboxylase/phosphopantothenate--cysteine ligase CoaBC [Bacteroidota bacterium]
MLNGKKILLGITGSIAAYKCAFLVRLLVKQGAEVKVIMSTDAKEFITPLTLATLSKNPVHSEFVKNAAGEWTNHVELGLWADVMLIAPASANTIAKMAHGICDNVLLATYLSAKCKVLVAPAMDLDMFAHPSTQHNLKQLEIYGNRIIPVGNGELASGLSGNGRMAEPEEITEVLNDHFGEALLFKGKKVLVTAGPTYENIDPVRFIGNYSSGKMGFAIAEAFAGKGADVTLVSGPTHLQASPGIKRVDVKSAADMRNATLDHFPSSDITVMSAAVADYTPQEVSDQKIKKNDDGVLNITLKKTSDILSELGKLKTGRQLLVGFALETQNEEANARQKLEKKNLDLIVLNSLNDEGAGFGHNTNNIRIIDKKGMVTAFELKSKTAVAADIVNKITEQLNA